MKFDFSEFNKAIVDLGDQLLGSRKSSDEAWDSYVRRSGTCNLTGLKIYLFDLTHRDTGITLSGRIKAHGFGPAHDRTRVMVERLGASEGPQAMLRAHGPAWVLERLQAIAEGVES